MKTIIGKTLNNRYRIDAILKHGIMFDKYQIFDMERSEPLLMNILQNKYSKDKYFLNQFKNRVRNLGKLQHPNILRFYNIEETNEMIFMLMDFDECITLRKQINENQGIPFSDQRILEIMRPICTALHFAHKQGIVHGRVSPENILLEKSGRILIDGFYEIFYDNGADHNKPLDLVDLAYLAPEQLINEDPIPENDIYSIGVLLYELITGGELPFTGMIVDISESVEEKVKWEIRHLKPISPKRLNPAISTELERIALKCLNKKIDERYNSPKQLLIDLEETLIKVSEENYKEQLPCHPKIKSHINTSEQPNDNRLFTNKKFRNELMTNKFNPIYISLVGIVIVIGIVVALLLILRQQNESSFEMGSKRERTVDRMVMVFVPSGPFIMGSDNNRADEKPEHIVHLDAFWVDQTEITNEKYEKCVYSGKCNPVTNKSSFGIENYYGNPGYRDFPVIYVTWDQANAYCTWVGGRLPNEDEWEKAARGPDGRTYPWGEAAPNNTLANLNPYGGSYELQRVGSYEAGKSIYGVYDLAGNVWEWTADWYDVYQGGDPNSSKNFGKTERVVRGSSLTLYTNNPYSSTRTSFNPTRALFNVGFRCASDNIPE